MKNNQLNNFQFPEDQYYPTEHEADVEFLPLDNLDGTEDNYEEDFFEEDDELLKTFDEIIYDDFEKKLLTQDDDAIEEELVNDIDLSKLPVSLEQAVADYQEGTDEAFDYLYDYYKPKLERLSYRKNDEELVQELGIVLLRAIQTFDDSCGAKFNTYFWKCARNHMGTLNIRKRAKKRTAENGIVSMQQPFSMNNSKDSEAEIGSLIKDTEGELSYEKSMFHMTLEQNVFPYLKENEITAIKMLLDGYTLEEIGQQLGGITAPAVHVKFRRLAEKKHVGKQLRLLYEMYCS